MENKGFVGKLKEKIGKFPFGVIPIIIVMSFVVLVVRYYSFEAHLSEYSWYVYDDSEGDMFNYYKGQCLGFWAKIMIAIIVGAIVYAKRFYFHKALIPLGIYAVLILISSICSEYKYFVLNGMDGHFETVFVLLTYCLLVVYSYWFVDSRKAVWTVLVGWLVGIALMNVVGMFQLSGHDLSTTEFGKYLLLPKESIEQGGEVALNFPKGTVYLTLYNPNYVGFYAALTIPVLTVLTIFVKNKIAKAICFVLDCLVFLCLLGSGARNGIVAVVLSLILLCVMFRNQAKKYRKVFLIAAVIFVSIFIGYDISKGGQLFERLLLMTDLGKIENNTLQKIETNDDSVVITYNNEKVILQMFRDEDGTYYVTSKDEDGNELECKPSETVPQSYRILDERFPMDVTVGKVANIAGFAVDIDGKTWTFSNNTNEAGYYYYNSYGKFTKIIEAETLLFTDYGMLANGRGYLWARTLPLLKDYFFIGSGPDTYTLVFPQQDYVAASKLGYETLLVTKPHSLYLQMATHTGVVSLLAFLAFNIIYLVESLRLYWKKTFHDLLECLGVGIMLAIFGYLVSALINDSSITVAPIYWCLMGIGLSVNRLVKNGNQISNVNCVVENEQMQMEDEQEQIMEQQEVEGKE